MHAHRLTTTMTTTMTRHQYHSECQLHDSSIVFSLIPAPFRGTSPYPYSRTPDVSFYSPRSSPHAQPFGVTGVSSFVINKNIWPAIGVPRLTYASP